MPQYQEIEKVVTVPKGTGVEGYLETLRAILKRPRVQEVVLRAEGTVTYRRYVHEGEREDLEVAPEFTTLMPYHILRSVQIVEMAEDPGIPLIGLARMFDLVSTDGLAPIAFGAGRYPACFNKYGVESDTVFGYPVLLDPEIPHETLVLFAGFTRTSALIDTRKAYKISLPLRK